MLVWLCTVPLTVQGPSYPLGKSNRQLTVLPTFLPIYKQVLETLEDHAVYQTIVSQTAQSQIDELQNRLAQVAMQSAS